MNKSKRTLQSISNNGSDSDPDYAPFSKKPKALRNGMESLAAAAATTKTATISLSSPFKSKTMNDTRNRTETIRKQSTRNRNKNLISSLCNEQMTNQYFSANEPIKQNLAQLLNQCMSLNQNQNTPSTSMRVDSFLRFERKKYFEDSFSIFSFKSRSYN